MSCKNCGHLKICHENISNHSCRLNSAICSNYIKWKKGDPHHMQSFYDSCKQGKSWKKGTRGGNGKFYGELKSDKDYAYRKIKSIGGKTKWQTKSQM